MPMATGSRIVPRPMPDTDDPVTRPYWEAARRGELVIPRCRDCQTWIFYPQEYCHSCNGNRIAWSRVSGRGRIFSFTVVRHVLHRGFAPLLPLVVVLIELDDAPGVRLVSNLVQCTVEEAVIGMPVIVTFEDIEGTVLPMFRPVAP